jgi:hypothetical protein
MASAVELQDAENETCACELTVSRVNARSLHINEIDYSVLFRYFIG